MKIGDKIRLPLYCNGFLIGYADFTVEEFRYCLGIFKSSDARLAGHFTPLCDLYEPSLNSDEKYISNYGEYHTNMVPSWIDISE